MNREPQGIPTGGQFATGARAEADLDLTPERDWGTLNITEGSRTPWNAAQHVYDVAPGIAIVSTASHGGVKLSRERNKEIPAPLRRSSGWYEEDSEAHIAYMHFPEEFAADAAANNPDGQHTDPDVLREQSEQAVRAWYPDEYTQATGKVVTAEQSHIVAEREYRAANAGFYQTFSAVYSEKHPGMVEVRAGIDGNRDEARTFLVDADEYSDRKHKFGMIIDTSRHQDITPPAAAVEPMPSYSEFDTSNLTPAGKARMDKDLRRIFRHDDGRVTTLRNIIDSGEISGKWIESKGVSRVYHLKAQEAPGAPFTAYPVSKTTYDAFEAPESPRERALADIRVASAKLEKARAGRDRDKLEKALAELEAARAYRDTLDADGS